MIIVKNPKQLKKDIQEKCTLSQFAKVAGYTKSYISLIVSGERYPNADVAVRICEFLDKQFENYFFISNVYKCQQED